MKIYKMAEHGKLTRVELTEQMLSNKKERDPVTIEKIDKKELDMGIAIEKEHTDSEILAREIAIDHLFEISDYYTRLRKMEEDAVLNNEDI